MGRVMKVVQHVVVSALLLLLAPACGSGAASHPLAGNWSEVLPEGQKGMTLTFDGESEKMVVHGRPQADNTHSHPKATYRYDAASQAVTVTGRILDGDKADSWKGAVAGDVLELAAADTKLRFQRGGKPHGH